MGGLSFCELWWWKVREAFPKTEEKEVAPDAPCLADHPVFGDSLDGR